MIFAIPIEPGVPHQAFRTDLDGETFGFEVRWNNRAGEWFIKLLDADDSAISAGKVVLGALLFSRSADARLPPGRFFVLDTSGRGLDASFDELGRRVQVVYADAASLAALGA